MGALNASCSGIFPALLTPLDVLTCFSQTHEAATSPWMSVFAERQEFPEAELSAGFHLISIFIINFFFILPPPAFLGFCLDPEKSINIPAKGISGRLGCTQAIKIVSRAQFPGCACGGGISLILISDVCKLLKSVQVTQLCLYSLQTPLPSLPSRFNFIPDLYKPG